MRRPELLAPAGDFICLQAALDAGADAVYFGLEGFNMRARSTVNFTQADLPEISRRCRERKVKAYMTLNAIVFENELADVEKLICAAKPYVDAFIVSDWGVISLCKKHGVSVHVSTQMSASNSMAVNFLKEQGAERVVLARECTLEEVATIVEKTGVEIETFVHGAQCVAVSGRCLMSQVIYGKSACRGACHQPCRRRFRIQAVDFHQDANGQPLHEPQAEFEITPHTVLSAKDLCSIGFVDRLMKAGIASFKIEGRARNADYVFVCVSAYRQAIEAVLAGTYTPELIQELTTKVSTVFHREFSKGMFYGRPGEDQLTSTEDSIATTVKRHCGVVVDYFLKAGIAQVKIQDHPLRPGDNVRILGSKTGYLDFTVGELHRDDERPAVAEKGTWVTFKAPRCRVGDKVFFVEQITRGAPMAGERNA